MITKPFKNYNIDVEVVNCDVSLEGDSKMFLNCILNVFSKYFPKIKRNYLKIIIDPLYPTPFCCYSNRTIYLKTYPHRWAQLAYQCFHEICHFVIFDESHSKMLWFEESLAELSSYFFLKELSVYIEKYHPKLTSVDNIPYYKCILKYRNEDMKKARAFNVKSIISNNSVLEELSINGINRELNATIAIAMLPVFEKHPHIWQIIPSIAEINETNFEKYLKILYNSSPVYYRKSMIELLDVFGIQI